MSETIYCQELSGRDIMQKVKDRPDGDSRQSEMTMTLINKRGRVRERKVLSYSIDVGIDKKDKKSMMFFQYPGDVKGTSFLTWDYDELGKDDDKWLYLPAMKKTRRISGSSAKKNYFMGTDFTYDDMGSRNIDEDIHRLVKEERIGSFMCWVIESVSKDKRDIYKKKISWIREDCLVPIKVQYYDKLDKLHRELKMSEIMKISGFWTIHKMEMVNVQNNHKTVLSLKNVKYNTNLEPNVFTVSRMEKGSL
jgi:hypothetical protein